MPKLRHSRDTRLLLIGDRGELHQLLEGVAADFGATTQCLAVPDWSSPRPPADLIVLMGGEGGCDPGWVSHLSDGAPGGGPSVLWATSQPNGAETAEAIALGADDVLCSSDGELLRLRFRRQLELAESRLALAELERERAASESELAERAQDVQALVLAHDLLTRLAFPEEATRLSTSALARLFPDALAEVRPSESLTGDGAPVPRIVVEAAAGGGWTAAALSLSAGAEHLGTLCVEAPAGVAYRRGRLDLLEVFATQVAQALHRSRLYEALSVGKAEWERSFDAIADTIAIVGPDYVIRRANRSLARLAGKEPRDLVGRKCHQALHGSVSPCHGCPVDRVVARGVEARLGEDCFRTNRTLDYSAYPLKDEEGRVHGAIVYGRDVTEVERLRRSLLQTEKLMTVGQIAAGIAHEINNPLTAISSYAQLLSLAASDPRSTESARRIEEGIARIHRLVQNLMSFVRPSDDNFYPLDVNDIVLDTLSFSHYELTRGEIRLQKELGEALPKVLGAKEQLEQILVNLLTNARDALAGRGTITVRTHLGDDGVVIQVEDDGVGINPSEAEKIFEPFYTTKPLGKGTGLGLFIAAGIAKKHRGEIQMRSDPGRGSLFSLSLPIYRA